MALRRNQWTTAKSTFLLSRIFQLFGRKSKSSDKHFASPDGFFTRQVTYLPIRKQRLSNRDPKLAVVLHAFYLDTALEMLRSLSNISIPFSLFITTTDENSAQIKSAVLAKLPQARCRVIVAKNRGRNFGPMLVDLRQSLAEYELVLHLHTKQSLRTGEEQTHWREHILDHLVGSPEIVQSILKLFQEDPEVGVVGPANDMATVPYWCQYWLANTALAEQWLPRFGVRHFPKSSLLDFPVGGMFWARTASIAGILNYPWTYEEFAPEPIPADGTLAHMLERAIGVVSMSSGFKYAETNLKNHTIRVGGSEKSLSLYLQQAARLKKDARGYSVISFDFYDTLFARLACSPEDVQHYIGHLLFSRGLTKDPSVFFRRRKKSESDLRRKSGYVGDVGIAEIYANISPTADFDLAAIEAGYVAELEVESRVLIPRNDIVNLAKDLSAQGKRLIIISDSYMPKRFFQAVLKKFALEDVFDEIYVSSEQRRRKDNGTLWQLIKDTEASDSSSFLHIGDNFRSDMQIPGDLDLPIFGVIGTSVLANMNGALTPDLWDLGETDWRSGLLLGPQVAQIGGSALSDAGGYPLRIESANTAGYCILGPLFFGFISWLTQRLRRDAVDRVYFLARDCEYIKEIYSSIRTAHPELGWPEPIYLEISRRAVLPAAIAAGLPVASFVSDTGHYNGSFGDFLESRLGVPQASIHAADRSVRIDPVAKPDLVLELISRNKGAILSHCASSLELLTRYLEQNGLAAESALSDAALVDLGYSGTIQSSLQAILRQPLKGYYFATSSRARRLDSSNGFATGYFGDQTEGAPQPDLYRFSILLEAFLQSSSGSVLGYTVDSGRVCPDYGPASDRSDAEQEMLRQCIDGGRKYCFDLINAYGPECLSIEFSARESEKPFVGLVRGEIRLATELEACLVVDDDFCGNGVLSAIQHVRSVAGVQTGPL